MSFQLYLLSILVICNRLPVCHLVRALPNLIDTPITSNASSFIYSSVVNFQGKIDIAVIATPKETVKDIINQCAKKKIKYVIMVIQNTV